MTIIIIMAMMMMMTMITRLAATPFKTKDRHCTDAPCLVLYLLALAAWVAVAVVAFMDGEPAQLLYPTDRLVVTAASQSNTLYLLSFKRQQDKDLVK